MTQQTADQFIGRTAHSADGERIGEVVDIYLDDQTEQPEWAAVRTGWFGSKVSFVPLAGMNAARDDLVLPYPKDQVKAAPNAEPDGALSQQEEAALYQHYGLQYSEAPSDSGLPAGDAGRSGATDDAMTRSEEELRIGKTSTEAGRVRLRKYVVTEPVQAKVTVAREEARVEREPITEANADAALRGPEISEAEHEIVLHEEHAVAEKTTVPKERVRLKEVTTDEEAVEAELAKEQIEVQEDGR